MIYLSSIGGRYIQILAIAGCINSKSNERCFEYNSNKRDNHLKKVKRKYELVDRKFINGMRVYFLTEKGRRTLMTDNVAIRNTALYVIGNTLENGAETKDEERFKRAVRQGEVITLFMEHGYTPFLSEKPNLFHIEKTVNKRCSAALNEMNKKNHKLNLPSTKKINFNNIMKEVEKPYEELSEKMYEVMYDRKQLESFKRKFEEELRESNKKSCYYTIKEIKGDLSAIESEEKLRRSRALGLLLTEYKAFIVYYPGDRGMRWENSGEQNMRMKIKKEINKNYLYSKDVNEEGYLCNMFIVDNYEVGLHIMKNKMSNNLRGEALFSANTYFTDEEDLTFLINYKSQMELLAVLKKEYGIQKTEKGFFKYKGEDFLLSFPINVKKLKDMDKGTNVFCAKKHEEIIRAYQQNPIVVPDELWKGILKKYSKK